jgi:hypothetical protein
MEALDNFSLQNGLDSNVLKNLAIELSSMNTPFVVIGYNIPKKFPDITHHQRTKIGFLEQRKEELTEIALRAGLVNEEHAGTLELAVSKTLTGRLNDQEFFVTTFGGASLSRAERKSILIALGVAKPTRIQADNIEWNSNYRLPNTYGADPSCVGPFLLHSGIDHVLLKRSPGFDVIGTTPTPPVLAEFALGRNTGLLLPLKHVKETIRAYRKRKNDPELIIVESPNRTIFSPVI